MYSRQKSVINVLRQKSVINVFTQKSVINVFTQKSVINVFTAISQWIYLRTNLKTCLIYQHQSHANYLLSGNKIQVMENFVSVYQSKG
jgi:hypothetical protein